MVKSKVKTLAARERCGERSSRPAAASRKRLLSALPALALALGDSKGSLDPRIDLVLVVRVVAQAGINVLSRHLQIVGGLVHGVVILLDGAHDICNIQPRAE